MTGHTGGVSERRRVTLRTTHADADCVADALAPDNTDSMALRVDDDTVVCQIERPTIGGLRSTVDDYVVNLRVATTVVDRAMAHAANAASSNAQSAETTGTAVNVAGGVEGVDGAEGEDGADDTDDTDAIDATDGADAIDATDDTDVIDATDDTDTDTH